MQWKAVDRLQVIRPVGTLANLAVSFTHEVIFEGGELLINNGLFYFLITFARFDDSLLLADRANKSFHDGVQVISCLLLHRPKVPGLLFVERIKPVTEELTSALHLLAPVEEVVVVFLAVANLGAGVLR